MFFTLKTKGQDMVSFSNITSLKWRLVFVICLMIIPIRPVYAGDVDGNNSPATRLFDPNSKIIIDYSNWSTLLRATVTRARKSSRIYAQKSQSNIGTRINYSSSRPTRLEASRVFYHYLGKEERGYIHNLRLAMEAIPQIIPLENLNRAEQLAYWLNLYNITVYEMVADHYPIRKLDRLYRGSRKTPSFWDKKILHVNSIPLSLNDIQYKIILKTWKDPLAIYGLYQGVIGGPNLRRKAYTGKYVYSQLEDNAEEFVNSLRGLRFKGKKAYVSEIYKRNKELFPNFKQDLRRHLRRYTSLRLTTRLDSSKQIRANIYDWHTADVLNGGRPPAGGSNSTNPAALLLSRGSDVSGTFEPTSYSSFGGAHYDKVLDTSIMHLRLPNDAAVFLKEFIDRNRELRNISIKVEEISKKDLDKSRKQRQNSADQ